MKTKDQGFGQGCRGIGVQGYKCLKPLHPYTLTPGLNRQTGCVSPNLLVSLFIRLF